VDPADVRVRLETDCDERSDVALSVVRYVRRTGQDVVLSNAAADDRFSGDPYVTRTAARSVVCVPVAHQGRIRGILYLENNLTTHAFTPERTEMLRILAAQAAISFENARLYDRMKAEVDRRTQAEESLRGALAELQVLQQRLEAENVYLQEEIRTQHNFNEIVGNSSSLLEALRRVELVAPTESTVLILGETGSGKELFARAIHSRSRRKSRPLVKVNCGAIAPGLVESELFGHVKGAFTGAIDKRVGRFEVANGGTIFLDEVGELPLDAQVKLLRVLQEQEFEPVGSSRTVKVDVRIIAATNRNLEQAGRDGSFRADLLYRLNVFPVEVPPLRSRKSDIPLLAGLFVSGLSRKLGKPLQGFTTRSMERLIEYSWPGNVRELQNVVERAAIVATGPVLEIDRSFAADQAPSGMVDRSSHGDTLDGVQRAHIVAVLKATGGVVEGKQGAASVLGLHPNTLRSRMKKLGITPSKSAS
jgi:formate hydrogenlyase transcriptional activator